MCGVRPLVLRERGLHGGLERVCRRSDTIIYQSPSKNDVQALFKLCGSFLCKNVPTVNHKPSAPGMKNPLIFLFSKAIELLLSNWDRIAYDLLGDQLLGLWRRFHLVVLISHQTDDSFLPSKEQSVFVNWAAGVLIGSSV